MKTLARKSWGVYNMHAQVSQASSRTLQCDPKVYLCLLPVLKKVVKCVALYTRSIGKKES